MQNKIYSMIGMCMRSGRLAYGSDMCEENLNKIRLIIVASDASENTKDKFKRVCKNIVKYKEYGTIDELSHSIGKNNKAVIGIMDEGFSKRIVELLEENLKGANN